jgi:hypothetical protein
MLENANKAIDNMLLETDKVKNKYFLDKEFVDACKEDPKEDIIDKEIDIDKSIKVDLGNGQFGNLKIDSKELDQKKNEENITS